MKKKTFYLGLGGQKCGSSWMQAYLNGQTGSDFGRLGEYQIWESDLGGVFARYAVPEPSWNEKLRAKGKLAFGLNEPKDVLRWRLQQDRNCYFDYFEKLLDKPGIVRTGDISPSYAGLKAETLAAIRDGFAQRGIAVRVLFSMRDPVSRLRSHLKMEQAKGRQPKGSESAILKDFYPSDEAQARARYDRTLQAIDQVFAPEEQFVCLYETLFTEQGLQSFAEFAGVDVHKEALSQQVNARGSGQDALPDSLAKDITSHYRPVYNAVLRRFPEAGTLWPSIEHLEVLN